LKQLKNERSSGRNRRYYILRIPMGDMRVMVPLDSADDVGLRGVIDKEDVEKVYESLGQ